MLWNSPSEMGTKEATESGPYTLTTTSAPSTLSNPGNAGGS
jgi:hypothetical protein